MLSSLSMVKHRNNSFGFTIVELLVVIVVIAILAAISIVAYNGIQTRARDSQRMTDIGAVQKALAMYRAENDSYPSVGSDNGGYNLSTLEAALVPKYLPKLPVDPKVSPVYGYVRGTVANDSYAIRMNYESRPNCHVGVNQRSVGWWGLPACESV